MPGIIQYEIDPLDTLESQIEELERRILGDSFSEASEKEPNVVEQLLKSNSTINNSIANHSSIKTLFDRLDELGRFIDPSFEDTLVDLACKKKVVLESENELREYLVQSNRLTELSKTLSGEPFKIVPALVEGLRKASEDTLKAQIEYEKVKREIENISVNYNSAIKSLNTSLLVMSTNVGEIEEKLTGTKLKDIPID